MQVIITAVGPDNRGLADPIIHFITHAGANIYEIQMYDHDLEKLFAMHLRCDWPATAPSVAQLRQEMHRIGEAKGLSIRTWSRDENLTPPRLAICTTYRPECAAALLSAMRDGSLPAMPALVLGNRPHGQAVAKEFGAPWEMIGDAAGEPDNARMVQLFDEYQVDYIILARYMRVMPPSTCWRFAGRIINLHHGLLPPFPGAHPYEDAHQHRMLTFGATVHFIVPELDAGNQIICQNTFTVAPGTPLARIKHQGETQNEPQCLVEGVRRVVTREVELHFHRVVRRSAAAGH
jgi:formyltetrahydrofolate deformylase